MLSIELELFFFLYRVYVQMYSSRVSTSLLGYRQRRFYRN